jgi:hypothetical protein
MKKLWLLFVCFVIAACGVQAPVPSHDKLAQVQQPLVTCPTPSALATSLLTATQASTLSLGGTDPTQCPQVSMTETWAGGKLVFSDSPESPSAKARLYDDATLGATSGTTYNRVFVYHVNGQSGNTRMKWTVLIKNLGTSSATLTVQQKGTAGPTTAYAYGGKLAFQRWLNSTAGTGVTVAAGAYARLDSTFDATTAAPTYLMHGIWDYSMTQPHEVIVCALNQNDDPINVCPGLSLASRDSHVRGTFPNADKIYDTAAGVTIDTASGIQALPLASGTANDSWAVGTDVTDGSSQTLGGNYGIKYRMHMSTVASDGQNLAWLYNPRGGAWGGSVNALVGLLPGGIFLLPPGTGMDSDNTTGVVEGEYSPGTGLTTWVQFMPTGGSSFPLQYVAVPY